MNHPVRPQLGTRLDEALHYLRIYFAPGTEGAHSARVVAGAVEDLRGQLAETAAERDALRATALSPDVAPRIAAIARLEDAAAIALESGATFTAQALTKAAQNLTMLRPAVANPIAARLLRSPHAHDTTTGQETTA